jgi:hypothetical protein
VERKSLGSTAEGVNFGKPPLPQLTCSRSIQPGIEAEMIRESGDGRAEQSACAMQAGKMRSILFGSAIGHRVTGLYNFLGSFVVAALFCFVAAILLYQILPEFLLQHHDGMHAYALLQTLHNWSQFTVGATVTPIEGMTTFSYPLNLYLTPHLWPFFFLRDPNARIFWIYVCYAEILFASCYFAFRAMAAPVAVSIAAALLTVLFWTTQQDTQIAGLLGLILYFVAITLGLFGRCGRGGLLANLCFTAGFVGAVVVMLSADVSTSILGGPTLCIVGLALLLSAPRSEVLWKVSAIVLALATLMGAGFPEYMLLLFRGTARLYFGNVISLQSRSFHTAGVPYHPSDVSRGLYVLSLTSSVGILAVSRLAAVPRPLFNLAAASVAVLIAWALVGFLYVTVNLPWAGPAPWYYQWAYYPFAILLPVYALHLACHSVSPRNIVLISAGVTIAGLAVLALLARADSRPSHIVALCFIGLILVSATFAVTRSKIILLGMVAAIVGASVQTPFVWADKRADMRDRLALNSLPILEFIASHVAIAPRQPFRGYLDDFYVGGAPTTTMVDEILKHWHENMQLYGSGLHTFNWQAFSIPTLSQYNAFITPEYFWLYSRLHDTPAQQQSVNMIAITRPNLKMLAAMGVRYLVVNDAHPELDEKSREVYSWKDLRVRELSDPNLMSYNPVSISVVASWPDALKAMAQPAFDPQRQVILDREPSLAGAIVPAKTRDARFERGGFHIAVEAQGPSIILLPVQYSHCYSIVRGRGQLARANVVMTALLVDGPTEIDAEFRFGPFGHTACRRRDLEDIEARLPRRLDSPE